MKHVLLALAILFILVFPCSSFASSRQQSIDSALAQAETGSSPAYASYENASSAQTEYPAFPEQGSPVNLIGASETSPPLRIPASPKKFSFKKKQAIEAALYLSGGYDLNHIHYSEWFGDEKLDEDFGYQNGFYINLGYKSRRTYENFWGKPFVEGYYRKYGATIQYKGGTFDPETGEDTGPLNVKQKSDITRYGLKLGTYTEFQEAGEVFVYLDGGERIWNRGQNGIVVRGLDLVQMYKEKYTWWYYGLGLGINYKILPKLSLGIDWAGWLTSDPKMYAYLAEGATFKLKNVWGTEVKLPVRYLVSDRLSLDLTPYYTFWRINQSDVISISGTPLVEPDSNTNELGILFGLTFTL